MPPVLLFVHPQPSVVFLRLKALPIVPPCKVLMWRIPHFQVVILLALVAAASSTVLRPFQVLVLLALVVSLAALGLRKSPEVVFQQAATIAVAAHT